jgi:hypothetical protein
VRAERGENRRMHLTVTAERSLPCTPEVAFAMATDPDRFPTFFTGFGPIPGIIGIRLHSPLAVGSQRRVHSADGVILTERVTEHDPPVRHGYTLTGFRAPMSWFINKGESMWTFAGHELGCRVVWAFEFSLNKRWLAPLSSIIVHVLMRRAMHRCLKNMARSLTAPQAATT